MNIANHYISAVLDALQKCKTCKTSPHHSSYHLLLNQELEEFHSFGNQGGFLEGTTTKRKISPIHLSLVLSPEVRLYIHATMIESQNIRAYKFIWSSFGLQHPSHTSSRVHRVGSLPSSHASEIEGCHCFKQSGNS